jgi:hypothetical protein
MKVSFGLAAVALMISVGCGGSGGSSSSQPINTFADFAAPNATPFATGRVEILRLETDGSLTFFTESTFAEPQFLGTATLNPDGTLTSTIISNGTVFGENGATYAIKGKVLTLTYPQSPAGGLMILRCSVPPGLVNATPPSGPFFTPATDTFQVSYGWSPDTNVGKGTVVSTERDPDGTVNLHLSQSDNPTGPSGEVFLGVKLLPDGTATGASSVGPGVPFVNATYTSDATTTTLTVRNGMALNPVTLVIRFTTPP